MDRKALEGFADSYADSSPLNFLAEENALELCLVGVRLYERPLMAVADADDGLFRELKQSRGYDDGFLLPGEWLPGAKSVITLFFPFTEAIRSGNKSDMSYPSKGWMNGRIEGQEFLRGFAKTLSAELEAQGYSCASPSIDSRLNSYYVIDDAGLKQYVCNWSERHAAYICGLGTFGLSKGIITRKGMAGRIISVITALDLPTDKRPYGSTYEYCTNCGKCVGNCPVGAISLESGKEHKSCSEFLDKIRVSNAPYYGCGKCQVNVPCEAGLP